MLGNISTLILVVCLAASVAGSALVRNIRQWDDDLEFNIDPYGDCGKPTTPIPNGGIKLFPVTDFDDPHDNSCNFGEPSFLLCEPKFYCDDGYHVDGDFLLQCVHDESTDEYEWEGNIPTCVKENYMSNNLSIVIAVVSFIVVTIIVIIAGAIRRRKTRNSRERCVTRTTTVIIPQSSTVSNGRSMLAGGPPGYTRFDDSNIQVPRDGTIQDTQGK